MSSLLTSLGSWLVNPLIFAGGAALVSVPIIIHLLNQRKFKIVDWAAMDFLLEADKKNRRRVKLENWLLLFLRCLAVFVLGLLLARPYDSSGLAARLFDAQKFERIVLVDDSLSMQAQVGNRTAMEVTRERLTDLVRMFSTEQSENLLTVLLTSKPEQRKLNGAAISAQNVDEVVSDLTRLEASEKTANLSAALQELDTYLASQPPNVNRVVYIVSDLRRRDWQPPAQGEKEGVDTPTELVRKISKSAQGCFLIDVGENEDRNLVISEVRPEKTLVAGVDSRFDVVIANQGSQDISDVRVKFTAGESVPLTQDIEKLAAGASETVRFSVRFAADEEENAEAVFSRKVKVDVTAERAGLDDRLSADSTMYFAARVVPGIPTLIVDGDPSAAFGKSESFYLKRALTPPGKIISGVAAEVVTESELETADLAKYQVIFLCNLYRLSDKALEDLRKWVDRGGGLVIFPGDQVDEEFFNARLYGSGETEGKELSPIKLDTITDDKAEQTWANFKVEDVKHPVLGEFAGQQNPILSGVKIFRWWKATIKNGPGITPASVLMRFSDADDSPAMVERAYGKGKVLVCTLPADADWTNWTSDPSYILIVQELVRHLSQGDAGEGVLRVGEPLRQVIDLTEASLDAELLMPGPKKVNLQASQLPGAEVNKWVLEQPALEKQGFYELKLSGRDGKKELVLFSANVDPSEGDLHRANLDEMKKELKDAQVQIVSGANTSLGSLGAQVEIWKYLLWLLVIVLLGEQVLGWFFGLSR